MITIKEEEDHYNVHGNVITEDDVQKHMKLIKKGLGNIPVELVNYGENALVVRLTSLINACCNQILI